MVKEIKIKKTEELSKILAKYNTIGLVDLTGVSTSTIQKIRKEYPDVFVRVYKYCVITRALEKVNKGLEKLKEAIQPKVPGLVLSNLTPFDISIIFDKFKYYKSPKAEKITPVDIVIPAGPTSLIPGPDLVELNRLGIKTKIEGGKIIIKESSTAIKAGEKVPESLTLVLPGLDIKPVKIKLTINKAWFKGTIYGKEDLEIDLDKYKTEVWLAYQQGVSLAYIAKVVIPETLPVLISDANRQAFSFAFNIAFLCNENKEVLLNFAYSQAVALATEAFKANKDALSEELKKFVLEKMLL